LLSVKRYFLYINILNLRRIYPLCSTFIKNKTRCCEKTFETRL